MHFAAAVAADEPPLQVVKPGEGALTTHGITRRRAA